MRVRIVWVFLFLRDGGWGPGSGHYCPGADSHAGDNDAARYDLDSRDGGLTWRLVSVDLSDQQLAWPDNSRLEIFDLTHPIIYVSANKHHIYFTRDRDETEKSIYSNGGESDDCKDDVNGRGTRMLVNIRSLQGGLGNNVGERGRTPGRPFANSLAPFYPGQFAWEMNQGFYSDASKAPPIGTKWGRWALGR